MLPRYLLSIVDKESTSCTNDDRRGRIFNKYQVTIYRIQLHRTPDTLPFCHHMHIRWSNTFLTDLKVSLLVSSSGMLIFVDEHASHICVRQSISRMGITSGNFMTKTLHQRVFNITIDLFNIPSIYSSEHETTL